MSVRFEFTLSDADAENLIDVLTDATNAALDRLTEPTWDDSHRAWFKARAEYLNKLKATVLDGNKRA